MTLRCCKLCLLAFTNGDWRRLSQKVWIHCHMGMRLLFVMSLCNARVGIDYARRKAEEKQTNKIV